MYVRVRARGAVEEKSRKRREKQTKIAKKEERKKSKERKKGRDRDSEKANKQEDEIYSGANDRFGFNAAEKSSKTRRKKRQRRKEKGVFKSMRLKSEKKMVYLQADKCTLEKTLIAKVEKVVPQ